MPRRGRCGSNCFVALIVAVVAACAAEQKSLPPILVEPLPAPAAPRAVGVSLATGPDGTPWLSWVERGADSPNSLRCAVFDATSGRWGPPRTIARDPSITASAMDFPQLALAPGGRAFALWTDGRGGARISRSADGGATWSPSEPFTRVSAEVEKFSLTVLADGRVLIAWLDGRGRKSGLPADLSAKAEATAEASAKAGGKMQQLYARILDAPGPDVLVDPTVCDCCPTALTPFLDGGALLAYRGRTEGDVRDIRVARFRGAAWDEPRPLNHDGWHITACPVNGPRLASDGGRVAAAWFTAADNDPRVLASYSPDAGARFLIPLRLERGRPVGHVDTAILRDGALLVTWLEADGSLWLRRVSPDFAVDAPRALAPTGAVPVAAFPRLALLRDYVGGKTSAQLFAAFASTDASAPLRTLIITVPEGALIDAQKSCDCAPTAEELQGFPVRGRVVAVEPGALHVRHGEVPGVLAAGTHAFRVAPNVLATTTPGCEFLGRIERRDGAWTLFAVRLLASAPAEGPPR